MSEQTPMNEADQNLLRNLIARQREEDPAEFLAIIFEALLIRAEDSSMTAFRHCDPDSIPDAMLVLFKGYKLAREAEKCIVNLMKEGDIE